MTDALLTWLGSYALHSTLLLAGLWAVERAGGLRRVGLRTQEALWRFALLGGVLSASLALLPAGLLAWNGPTRTALQPMLTAPVAAIAAPAVIPALPAAPLSVSPAPVAEVAEAAGPSLPELAHDLALMLAGLWAVGALWGLVELGLQAWWLRRTVRRLAPLDDERWQRLCEAQARRQQTALPRLRRSPPEWSSPLLAPGRVLCLPAWALDLPDDEAEAVLGHELAHLRRRDPAWRLLAALVNALLWPQPLNRLALTRLELLAELACDARAAAREPGRLALAQALLRCAELKLGGRALPALACGAATSGPSLQARVRQLLGRDAAPARERPALRWGLLATLAAALLALPAVVVSHTDARALLDRLHLGALADAWPPGWVVGSVNRTQIRSMDGDTSFSARLEGQASFNDAEDDLQSLDGRLNVRERQHGQVRELTFSSQAGRIVRDYRVDGSPAAWDEGARQWWTQTAHRLSAQLTDPLVRARRLLARGGLEAVLADLAQPADDHLLSRRIVATLGLGQVLPAAAQDRLIAAAAQLQGSFERREALVALAALPLAEAQQLAWLQAAADVEGDFDRREALAALAPRLALQPAVLAAWQQAVARIEGDFDKRTALDKQLRAIRSPALQAIALQLNPQLQGDFDKREALATVAGQLSGQETALVQAYVEAATQIQGDFERREALNRLLDRPQLGAAGLEQVLGAAESMTGDFERLQVLLHVADRLAGTKPVPPALVERLRRAGRGLGEQQRGQLENALDRLG